MAQTKSPDYSAIAHPLEQAAHEEMAAWGITGIAIALVDGQQTVYAAGFGEARRESVFRCGSISKLFNAVAVMQLVEAGKLDLDAPLERYGPELLPVNPFAIATPVTLRELLCHRSGMIREAPVGGYFDDSQPGLARTIESISQAVLVNPPDSKTRYSNVGPSLAGRIVERVAAAGFEQYQREHVLDPLGMTNSVWRVDQVPHGRLIASYMRVAKAQGGFRRRRAPLFDLGTVPAGNLFTTADDLARFVAMLAAGGRTPRGRILQARSLAQMFTPQLSTEPGSYGLGFALGRFCEHKMVNHNGAVYGHSASLVFLPDTGLGVVVLGNEDIANARIQKLANHALSLMLEVKCGEKPPAAPEPLKISADILARFCGDYESQSFWATLKIQDGRLAADLSGQPTRLTPVEPFRFLADSRVNDAVPVDFEHGAAGQVTGFTMGLQKFARVPAGAPRLPASWRAYLGSYGPDFIPLVVSARHGHLYAMTENLADYRLTPLDRHVFSFPLGLYTDEHLVFLTDRRGKARAVDMANMILERR